MIKLAVKHAARAAAAAGLVACAPGFLGYLVCLAVLVNTDDL